MIKQYLQYVFFISFVLSCATTQELSELGEEDSDSFAVEDFEESDEALTESSEEDLENEFAESEDFEGGDEALAESSEEDLENEFAESEDFEGDFIEENLVEESDLEDTETASEEELELVDEEDLALLDEENEFTAEEEDISDEELAQEESAAEEPSEEELAEGEDIDEEKEVSEEEQLAEETEEVQEEELAEGEVVDEEKEISEEQLAEETEEVQEEELVEGEVVAEETPEEEMEPDVIVNSISYKSAENKVYIEGTGSLSYQTRENASTNQIIIEIPNAVLSDNLKWPFVLKDFNTQIGMLQADQKDSNTVRIVIQMRKGAATPSIDLSDSGALVIASDRTSNLVEGQDSMGFVGADGSVLPAKSFEEFFMGGGKFSGRPISIHLKNVNIRDVLYFISEETGLNMVIADDVAGNISIKLRNVPWDQALVTIMKTKKLGYLREGNVIRIMTMDALKIYQREIDDMKVKVVEPMQVRVIPIVYTKANEIVNSLQPFLTPNRGQALVDARSNAIIVTDIAEALGKIKDLVKYMDTPPKQVMIEAKIVEARESFVRNLGLNWSLGLEGFEKSAVFNQPNWDLNLNGNLDVFPAARTGGTTTSERTLVYPFNVAFTPVGFLDAIISISETDGLANVISSPRVLVLSGKRATISQRTQNIDVVTQQSSDTGQTLGQSPQKTPVILTFTVTPEVTAIGSVFMDINMQRDFVGNRDVVSGSRPINSRQASTSVLARNGQTIVIGGIYQSDKTQFKEGIPFLKHIPILKWFFSQRTRDENRNELLLFVTPRVLDAEQEKIDMPETDSFSFDSMEES